MVTELITRRFAKFHERLLAHLDALEEATRDLCCSSIPSTQFLGHEGRLQEFFQFLESAVWQHELEEEKILLPVIESHLGPDEKKDYEISPEKLRSEHEAGRLLVSLQKRRFLELQASRPAEAGEYYQFCNGLLDLIWHFRRHIWKEDCFLFPAAERLIPDREDRLWALDDPAALRNGLRSKARQNRPEPDS